MLSGFALKILGNSVAMESFIKWLFGWDDKGCFYKDLQDLSVSRVINVREVEKGWCDYA
jgi:hypothetical protein